MSRPPSKETNVQLFPALLGIVGVWLLFNQNQEKLGGKQQIKATGRGSASRNSQTNTQPNVDSNTTKAAVQSSQEKTEPRVQQGTTEKEKPAPINAESEKLDQKLAPDILIDTGKQARPEEKKQ